MKISPAITLPFLLLLLILSACDNGGSSSVGGSGQAEPETKLVGPNLNGNDWAGYFKNTHGTNISITAVIQHVDNRVTIQTSKKSGVASMLTGTIDSRGRMTMYDTYDNEDWTTNRPATRNSTSWKITCLTTSTNDPISILLFSSVDAPLQQVDGKTLSSPQSETPSLARH